MKTTKLFILFLVGVVLLFHPHPTAAQNTSSLATSAAPMLEGPNEAADLEPFLDPFFRQQIEKYHLAGITAAVVKDGQVLFQKGYGYANLEKQIPVDPAETIFRLGSTSKIFTWTAVMQLAEQGKIDLNADVNTYLPDFQIPATYPEPITLLSLMSHSSGFEDRYTGIEARRLEDMLSLHDYLANYMPARVHPVGDLIAYSNYGAALAGYIVEAVSGMPFEQYCETYLFEPLSMSHSSFRQPLPSALEGHLANSYSYNGEYLPGTHSYPNLSPAATMASTANDMAHFLIAQLQDGRFEDHQILKPETVRLMHTHLSSNDKRLDGFAYGFFEEEVNGKRVLWHFGDIDSWHSGLAILPEENLGFFVDYNSDEGFPAVSEFYYSLINAFFPVQEEGDPPPAVTASHNPKELAGIYRSTRSVYRHIERVTTFPGNGYVQVMANPDHTLSIAGQTYYEKEFLVYSPAEGKDTLVFHQDDNGKITHLQFNSFPFSAFERITWYESPAFNLLVFIACYVLLLSVVLAALIGIFRRQKGLKTASRLTRIARIWAFIVSVVFTLAPIIISTYMTYDYKYPFPSYMVIVLAIINAAAVSVVGLVIFTILAWKRRFWGLAGRIHYTLLTVGTLGMIWLMHNWNLLGFRY